MKVLITGATGFLGQRLTTFLTDKQYEIAILARDTKKLSASTIDISKVTVIDTSLDSWKKEVVSFNPENVFHLASYLTSASDQNSIDNLVNSNLLFGVNLLDALKDCKINCFFNFGSFSEYLYNNGELIPAYLYAASKTAFRPFIQFYANTYGFKHIHIIPYTIYGYEDTKPKLIDLIYNSINADSPINLSPGNQVLDFIHIDDILHFLALILLNNTAIENASELFLGSGTGTTPIQVAKIIEQVCNKKTNINWGGVPYRQNDTLHSIAPIYKLKKLLNWSPQIDIAEGIRMYINNKG